MRTSPNRVAGSITGDTCHTEPVKVRADPTGSTVAGTPTPTLARSSWVIRAIISI